MCFAYQPATPAASGKIFQVQQTSFLQLLLDGKVQPPSDGFLYAKATVGAILFEEDEYKVVPMRWDLVPRDFMRDHPEFDLAAILKKKNSRAKNPDTQLAWGFDSFNA